MATTHADKPVGSPYEQQVGRVASALEGSAASVTTNPAFQQNGAEQGMVRAWGMSGWPPGAAAAASPAAAERRSCPPRPRLPLLACVCFTSVHPQLELATQMPKS